ncbi:MULTISPECIES: cation-transporting P-type ATPase [unclassified Streptomyces]|uniref:cation-transporting P-type ATPase n=1 Tax=unclassified Streptomyces TaxID=2593676 RepID=UPI0038660179
MPGPPPGAAGLGDAVVATPTDVLTPGGSGEEAAAADADGLAIRTLPPIGVYSALDTSPRGLTTAAADARLRQFGSNELPRAAHPAMWRQVAAQFTDLFAVVLLIASAITFLAYALQEPRDVGTLQLAVAILGVVVLNASIGFAQEYSAERTAESLQAMVPHTCRVLRDAVLRELPARELVHAGCSTSAGVSTSPSLLPLR